MTARVERVDTRSPAGNGIVIRKAQVVCGAVARGNFRHSDLRYGKAI